MKRWMVLSGGGLPNLKIAPDEIFNVSDIVITSLQQFFKKLAWDGIAKYPSENVELLVQKINTAAELLAKVPLLPRDTPLLALTGFTKFSMTEFVGPLEMIINIERVIKLKNDGDRQNNKKFLERMKKLTLLESKSFHYLNVSNQWNIPSNHGENMTKGKSPWGNCGGKNHAPYLPHPCD